MSKLISTLLILVIFSSMGEISTYRVFVDKEFGFFGVRENSTNFTDYSNHTLYIGTGDKIEWENFVATDERITIVSDNKLWNESEAVLGWNYKVFSYTFNKAGTYKFHIKENQIYRPPENLSIETKLPFWFEYQVYVPTKYQKIIVGSGIKNATVQPKKNKIIATKTTKNVIDVESYLEEDEIIPQATTKIEKKVSPYQKYTILELIKSIFVTK